MNALTAHPINVIWNEETSQLLCKDCGLIYEPMEGKLEENFEKSHGMKKR